MRSEDPIYYQILSFDRSQILGTVESYSETHAAEEWTRQAHGELAMACLTYDHGRRMVVWQAFDERQPGYSGPLGDPFQVSPEH